ncbi:ABC transporter permease [Nostoc sp. FACHB-152]|uniref:ABC transporter permease n=1 Tax=unclassified Nostoc TaxID=2593658 RepID=UPI001683D714|nr:MULTISPECIES: ABC transporter permease [unclassified Nostoc]MBD2445677.1 ABC transporter permease [Nostoc sp. FACHB-152]MBD2466791.1 ABC transporter permease [Nostoc sp. FACHB-145]
MGTQVVIIVGTFVLLLIGLLLGYVLSQLVLGFLTFNLLTFFGTLSLILIFGTLYYVLFWQLRREQSPVAPENMSATAISDRITDNQLKNKLIAKLDGDTAAAERLIEQAKQNYPGMPENWYCERVIDDLEREQS